LRFGFQEAVSKKCGYKNEDLETILSARLRASLRNKIDYAIGLRH